MITDLHVAALCAGIYAYPGAEPVSWDRYDNGRDDRIVWALKKIDGVWVVVFRGSVTVADWIADAAAVSIFARDLNAFVHPGFYYNMAHVWNDAKAIIGSDPFIVAGHSLGAARATIFTACAVLAGRMPLARVVWGEPRSGFSNLAAIVARAPGRSYMNQAARGRGHDLVTDVPFTLMLQPYRHATPLIPLSVTPPPYDGIDGFRFHHMPLYLAATPATVIV